jgi:hypothetical protein
MAIAIVRSALALRARTRASGAEHRPAPSLIESVAHLGRAKLTSLVRPLTGHVVSAPVTEPQTREQQAILSIPLAPYERSGPRRARELSPQALIYADTPPVLNAPWPYQGMKPREAFGLDRSISWRPVLVNLPNLQPVHYVGLPTARRTAQILNEAMIKAGYPDFTDVPEKVLRKILGDEGQEGKEVYVSELIDGRRVVLNGNRRLAALAALVADGRRPPSILTHIPAKEVPFTVGYPDADKRWAIEKMTWGKVLVWTDIFADWEDARRLMVYSYAARGISFPSALERNQITYTSADLYAEEFAAASMRRKASILDHVTQLQPQGLSRFLAKVFSDKTEDMAFVIEPMLRLLFRVPGDRTTQVLSLSDVIWRGESHSAYDMSFGIVESSRYFSKGDGLALLREVQSALANRKISSPEEAIRLAYDLLYAFQDAMANVGNDSRTNPRDRDIYYLCYEAVQEFQAALDSDDISPNRSSEEWALSFALLLARFVAYHERSSWNKGETSQRVALKTIQTTLQSPLPH